jgi:hypothetical protein
MESHLRSWQKELLESVTVLGQINRQFFERTGFENCLVKEAAKEAAYRYTKACRYYQRFAAADWLEHDMSVADDALHAKCKAIEEG